MASDARPVAPAPEVAALATDGSLSVDGFVYVDGEQQQPSTPAPRNTSSGISSSNGSSSNDGSNSSDSAQPLNGAAATGENGDDSAAAAAAAMELRHRQQLVAAIQSLTVYNPDFALTPDVVEIMRVFFEDLGPDADGTIALRALFDEVERLDPEQALVPADVRARMWRDMVGDAASEADVARARIDFHGFCAWVMHWKEISPAAVRNMYTSWAQQLAMVDFGLHEADGVFVVRADELPPSDVLKTELSKLLQARARRLAAASGTDAISGTNTDTNDIPSISATAADAANPPPASVSPTPTTIAPQAPSAGSVATVSKSFLAGGAAGIVAKSALAPVDRVKIMFQVSATRQFSFRNAVALAREIYVQDGFRALFRGNLINILRVVPYAGVQHASFDLFRRQFHARNFARAGGTEQPAPLSNAQLVTAGSLAGGLSLVVAYPLDIVRARYMVQQGRSQYQTLAEAVAAMYRADGARSFTRGLVPSLLGTLPYTGIGFALSEKFKAVMLEFKIARLDSEARSDTLQPPRLNPFSKFLCSYLAACIAQTTTYPMDTIRRRIQTDGFVPGARGGELRYTGVAATARIILAQEGWRGFFKGVSVNWMRSPLATGISLTTYDVLKDVMGVEKVV